MEHLNKDLVAILKKHRVLTKFKTNLRKMANSSAGASTVEEINRDFERIGLFRTIARAFSWRNSPEGHNFWSDIAYSNSDET